LRVLGEGGSGIVYEVRVRSGIETGRATLALKVLRAELAPSERERRRFLEEAERMQRLHAPGLVELLEAGLLPDGRPYLAMPLLDGETLSARLRRGPLDAATAVRYFGVLARAVHALHAAGMVHRDVKPENVIIVDDAPVLLDFGIARDIDDDTTTTTAEGRVRGTPAYMAPERFFGAPASVRSDVYELGVVLYTMLVGRLPWGSEKNVTERLNPASPRDAGADVSSALATVILRALSTRPEMRPASAEDLARDVAAATAELASPSRRTLDVEIQEPPFATTEAEKRAIETAMTEAARASKPLEPTRPQTQRGFSAGTIGAAVGVIAVIAVIAAAAGMKTKAPSPTEPSSASAAGSVRVSPSAPALASAPTPASASASALTSAPALASAPTRASASAPTRASAPAHAPAPPVAIPPKPPDSARYFEDRK
jgi:serine/threonine-protein kinase